MSYSSEDETDISESELEEYVDRCYMQLKDDEKKVKFSDELFRCPYCPGKKKVVYPYKDLLQHASDVGKGSQNKGTNHKGKHLGLVKYIKNNLVNEDSLSSELSGLNLDLAPRYGANELFVFPWMGILANVDADESISNLKNDLAKKGFEIVRIRPLSSGGFAVVEFKKEWCGFYNAVMFDKEFEVGHHGKKEYSSASVLANGVYGWIACGDDYDSKGVLGNFLQKNGDLKTLADVEADEKRKTGLLVANLNRTIEELKMRIDELEGNHHVPSTAP